MYHANRRVGTASTKGRGQVAGSTRKLFRQKGTGNARVGNVRTGKRVGGGVTFAKFARDFGKDMPKKQKSQARDSAVLEKLIHNNVVVVDDLDFEKPRTKEFTNMLGRLNIENSCLVTINDYDTNLYKSARNIARISVMPVAELNAGEICNYSKILFTRDAFLTLLNKNKT
jgi:large subunit ribosomal protein L4